MTFASLNLHCGFSRQDQPYDVSAAICQLDAAVVCLQEVWQPLTAPSSAAEEPPDDPLAGAAEKIGAEVYRAQMCGRPSVASLGLRAISGPGQLGIAVLTTLPVSSYRIIELGCAPGDGVPRVAQVLRLELPGGPMRLVNTHLTHVLTSPVQLTRLIARLRRDRLTNGSPPTLIAGDLNMPRKIAGRFPGLTPAVTGPTYPADRPRVQIDHLLASRSVATVDTAVLPPAGSDHLPIRARLLPHS